VDIRWKDGELIEAKIMSKSGLRCSVKYQDKSAKLETEKGGTYLLDKNLHLE
jgi:hypothetical protein